MSRAASVTVSRSSSASSMEFASTSFALEQRRTRKRITAAQLAQLEELYRQSSHPTREQRDALAQRIQMATKSVTIWFQNKRQTDRKVALNNATSSRNLLAALFQNPTPNITITTPTSPSYSLDLQKADIKGPESDACHPSQTSRSNPVRRTASYSSSGTRTKPSLDRVASRSEIRFTERIPPSRTMSLPAASYLRTELSAFSGDSPVSPPRELWSNMPSSPMAPSSPPPQEIVEYARTRKSKSLDWACTVARLEEGGGMPRSRSPTLDYAPLKRRLTESTREAIMHERDSDHEGETILTDDESELVTPQNSQDVPISWAHDDQESLLLLHLASESIQKYFPASNTTNAFSAPVKGEEWQEDEVHAALALCGLRG